MSPTESGWVERVRRRLPTLWRFLVERFRRGERYGLDFTLAFAGIAASLWIFAEIVDEAVTESDIQSLDLAIQSALSGIFTPPVIEWIVFVTDLGGTRGTIIGVVLVSLPLLVYRRWWSAFGLVFATAGGGLVVWGLKTIFERARPAETLIDVGGYAFPSGHAFAATVYFGYLVYLAHKHLASPALQVFVTVVSFSLIMLIGSSRVFLNVHWLTDVLGGFLAGFAWLVLSILIVRHVEWPERRTTRTPTHKEEPDPL